MSSTRPFVSVLTPTYNRRKFIPAAIACFKAQTYPQDRMEWIILDDGTDKVGDLFAASGLKNVRYVALPDGEKLPIGAKRNRINKLAKGDIVVCWDDDDYYFPDRVRQAVLRLQGQKAAQVVGSTEIYMYFPDRDQIWSAGPYNPNHATNGTVAYWRSYFKTHKYDDTAEKAEERQFFDDWKTPICQLRPEHVMLVICHDANTFDKRRMLDGRNKAVKPVSLTLKALIKDTKLRNFYKSLGKDMKPFVDDTVDISKFIDLPAADLDLTPRDLISASTPALPAVDLPALEVEEVMARAGAGAEAEEKSVTSADAPPDPEHPPVSVPAPPAAPEQPPLPELPVQALPSSSTAEA